MSNLIFGHSYMKYELNGAYKYTKIHVIELEIPRCSVRFYITTLVFVKLVFRAKFWFEVFFNSSFTLFMFI